MSETATNHTWTRHPANPLLSLRPGRFDSFHIHAPMVVKEGGRYRMWYSGSDRTPNEYHRIGYAESRDGVTWERLDEPVLVPGDPSGYFSVPAVLRTPDGEVLKQDGLYRMWFTGHNLMCDLRTATSPDGIEWTLHSEEPLRTDVYCPTIIFEGGLYKMWYTNLDRRRRDGHLLRGQRRRAGMVDAPRPRPPLHRALGAQESSSTHTS